MDDNRMTQRATASRTAMRDSVIRVRSHAAPTPKLQTAYSSLQSPMQASRSVSHPAPDAQVMTLRCKLCS